MEPDTFLRQAELLTGTPVKDTELVDQESLTQSDRRKRRTKRPRGRGVTGPRHDRTRAARDFILNGNMGFG